MKARCLSDTLTDEQRVQLGLRAVGSTWPLTPGKAYLVLGISFYRGSLAFGTGVYLEIISDGDEYVKSIPSNLFEVVDGRCSATWIAHKDPAGSLSLWPPYFYERYFHDDLSEGAPESVDKLREVLRQLEGEDTG